MVKFCQGLFSCTGTSEMIRAQLFKASLAAQWFIKSSSAHKIKIAQYFCWVNVRNFCSSSHFWGPKLIAFLHIIYSKYLCVFNNVAEYEQVGPELLPFFSLYINKMHSWNANVLILHNQLFLILCFDPLSNIRDDSVTDNFNFSIKSASQSNAD